MPCPLSNGTTLDLLKPVPESLIPVVTSDAKEPYPTTRSSPRRGGAKTLTSKAPGRERNTWDATSSAKNVYPSYSLTPTGARSPASALGIAWAK